MTTLNCILSLYPPILIALIGIIGAWLVNVAFDLIRNIFDRWPR